MRKAIIILLSIVNFMFYNGCISDEEQYFNYRVIINNESSHSLNIEAYFSDNLSFENSLVQNQNSAPCEYSDVSFLGYSCMIDSMVFKFDNGKGYISTLPFPPSSANEYDFPDKSPFTSAGYINTEGNTYEFIITKEDYNNAFDID